MERIEKEPGSVRRYREIGGVLDFTFFEGVDDTFQSAHAAIDQALTRFATGRERFDPTHLRLAPCKRVSKDAFLGDWFDNRSGLLIRRGVFTTDTGQKLIDPTYKQLEGVSIRSGSSPVPALWAGGQFAYAFSQPPYGLQATPNEIQALFRKVCDVILPPWLDSEIIDWCSPELAGVSDYFLAGAEWWGAFLFTVRVPVHQRMTIILGSATD